jgi:penicillin-binding protein 1C
VSARGRRRWRRGLAALALAAGAWLALPRVLPRPLLVNRPGFSQAVTARDGSLLHLSHAPDGRLRLFTPLDEVPAAVVDATLLQEDRHFHRHPGVNPFSLLRALRSSYLGGARRVGGSTLTMQVARLRFGLVTRTPRGKLVQILRALELELFYTKREILEAYLNLAPYGANVEGVGAASLVWFGRPVSELGPAEALALAVLPQSPVARSPETEAGRRAWAAAREGLARRWREAGFDAGALATAGSGPALAPLALRTRRDLPYRAPHLVDRLLAEHPFEARLASALDPSLQRLVERQVALHVERARRFGIRNAAVLLLDHLSMQAVAYVGSADHADASLDGAVDGVRGRRSPGSALKPFLYGLALDAGLIHPQSMLRDASLTLSAWNPENFDREFLGPIAATDALVRSRNLPAVQLANALAPPGLHGLLARAVIGGLLGADHYGLALALGGVEVRLDELAGLYAMLANGGVLRPVQWRIDSAEDRPAERAETRLLSREASRLVLEMLRENPRSDPAPSGTRTSPGDGIPWKTGTSFGFRDAWALGLVGHHVLGVWVGNFDGTPNPAFVGRDAAGPLFFGIADALRAARDETEAQAPLGLSLVRAEVCALSGAMPGAFCPSRKQTWFIPGRSPIAGCAIHREVAIDAASGLRACPGEASGVRREVYEFWPSDLLALFRAAGIARRTPPPFAARCAEGGAASAVASAGAPLRIESPQPRVTYLVPADAPAEVPLSAVSDADARRVHWFVDDAYVGESASGATLFWPARPGRFVARATDDLGRSQTRAFRVALASTSPAP